MATEIVMKTQARQTRPRAALRALGQLATQQLRRCEQREAGKHISRGSQAKTSGEETHESDQGDSELTNLFDNALCCAIGPCRDNPVVSRPGAEYTATCLQDIEEEKRDEF